jgi:predicted CXXCH cytochrome family protein
MLSEPDVMKLCQQCHEDATKTHFHPMGAGTKDPNRDGPIVCTGCHSPHNSDNPALLLGEPNRELCVRCHDPSAQHQDQPKKK